MRADAKEARSLQSGLSSRNREKWAGSREFRKKRRYEFSAVQTVWRRERDSNPRYGFPYSGFQDRLFQPLTHPSAGVTSHALATASLLPLVYNRPKGSQSSTGAANAADSASVYGCSLPCVF